MTSTGETIEEKQTIQCNKLTDEKEIRDIQIL